MVHYPAGSSHQRMGTRWPYRDGHVQKEFSGDRTFKQCQIGTKGPEVYQENIPHTITPPAAAACTVLTRHNGFMFSLC